MGSVGSAAWTAIAALAVAGFLVWIYTASRARAPEVSPQLASDSTEAIVHRMSGPDLDRDLRRVVGIDAWVDSVPVAEQLGRAAFALQLEGAVTYPVLLSSDLIQRGTQVYGGDRVSVFGHFFTFNDSIRAEWVKKAAVFEEAASHIPSSPSFLLADSLNFIQ